MNNLLEQWNEHYVKGNRLSGDIENFDNMLARAQEGKVCVFKEGCGTSFIDTVLDDKVMIVLKDIVINTLTEGRNTKMAELEQLMGVKRKPATINPDFEAVLQDMVASVPPKVENVPKSDKAIPEIITHKKYPEMTVEMVKELYHDKGLTLDAVAKEFGVNRTALYNFVTKNNLRKPSKIDIEKRGITVPKSRKERP